MAAAERLREQLQASGRFPGEVPPALLPTLASLAESALRRGFPASFPARAAQEALRTADPAAALTRLATLFSLVEEPGFYSLLEDPDGLRSLLAVLGYSSFLSALIQRHPEDYVWLMREAGLFTARTAAVMEADLAARLPAGAEPAQASPVLRRQKYREMLRIGVKDLLGAAPFPETVREISALAEASIEAAVEVGFSHLRARFGVPLQETPHGMTRPARFAVLGMGKLGGEELNYSSDVDLYYLYSTHHGSTTGRPTLTGGHRDSVENHVFFVKLAEVVTALVGERTTDGIVFRVDMRLRPEGDQGELAWSLPALETYYQSWGRFTDRLALLKARPVGGDRRLGEELLSALAPFIWPRLLDYSALEELGMLKARIEAHAGEGEGLLRNLKLGRGGIREIEFLVQALQLVHGGRNPSLRERGTLRALTRLDEAGFLGEREAGFLSEAYVFLRAAEHRVQLVEERQTQELPRDPAAMGRLAHAMGFTDETGEGDADAFRERLGAITGEVRALYERHLAPARAVVPVEGAVLPRLLAEETPREEAEGGLAGMGFTDPAAGYQNLLLLRDGPPLAAFPDASRRHLRRIAPVLVEELASSPDPDAVLGHLTRFIPQVGSRASYLAMLAESPRAVHLLAVLFAHSPFLTNLLLAQPDLLDLMVGGEDLGSPRPRAEVEEEARAAAASPTFEEALGALRRVRNAEYLRVGLGDLLGFKDTAAVNAELTQLAEVILERALLLACRDLGFDPAAVLPGFAVVAMGKMGGREMTYGSDLDLVFIRRGAGAETEDHARETATQLAQRVLTLVGSPTAEGVLYSIDTRMRPSGHSGPLVTTLDAFRQYHREEALPWEHQALTRARVVAPGREKGGAAGEGFGREVAEALAELCWGRALTAEELAEIRRVRGRMEEELAGEAPGRAWDIKTGKGGLVDVEFAAQALLLLYAPSHPSLRKTSTAEALSALASVGLLDESGYNALRAGYLFYRRVEGRLRIASDRPDPKVPRDPGKCAPLARRLGYPGKAGEAVAGEAFLAELGRVREETRRAFLSVMEQAEKILQTR